MSSQSVVATALAEVESGYQEGANNDTKYGKWFGLNNQPWCAMFVSWCFAQHDLSALVAGQTKKGFASCDAGLKWFARNSQLVPVGQAQEGDIAFFQFDEDSQPDHVGIVVKNNTKLKRLVVAEGNTAGDNKGSQSNGDGVYLKKRSYDLIMAVARPKYPASKPAAKSADEARAGK
jgi:cell wall-associated NlpC family hydrolase